MAIAFDSATSGTGVGGVSSASFTHTSAGSNRFVAVNIQYADNGANLVSGVTYDGVAMTQQYNVADFSNRIQAVFYLVNPSTTTNANIVVTFAGTITAGFDWACTAASYTGVAQTSPVDVFDHVVAGSGTSTTKSATTTVNNDWLVSGGLLIDPTATVSASTNTTKRAQVSSTLTVTGQVFCGDSNAAQTPAGSYGQTYTWTPNTGNDLWVMGIKPVAASGPANWKTWNTVTVATNLKTLNTNTLANIKTYDTIF